MTFLASFVSTLVKMIIFAVIGFAGILAGKKLRTNKDAKEAASEKSEG